MHCSGDQYKNKVIDCESCSCILNDGDNVCIAYEVNGTFGGQNEELMITRQDGYILDQIVGTKCNASVSVTFRKGNKEVVNDHVKGKNQVHSKGRTFPPQSGVTIERTSNNQQSTSKKSTREIFITQEDIGIENLLLQKRVDCGKYNFRAAFYVTLISFIVFMSFVIVAFAVYFARKRLQNLRNKSTAFLQDHQNDDSVCIEMPAVNENEYATIEETTAKGIRVPTQIFEQQLESHYVEPCFHEPDENPKSIRGRRKKASRKNEYLKFQSCHPQFLRNTNDDYLEPRKLILPTPEQEKGIGEYFQLQTCSSKSKDANCDTNKDLVPNEYFELQPSSLKPVIESKSDTSNEYFQLEKRSTSTKCEQPITENNVEQIQ